MTEYDKRKHAGNQYRCTRCGKRFESLRSVKDHSSSHNGELNASFFEIVDRDKPDE